MRHRVLALSTVSLVVAASFAAIQPAGATPPAPGPTLGLPSLTDTSWVAGQGTGGPGTAALNNAVRTECNSGNAVAAPQWYTLPSGDLGFVNPRVLAHKADITHNGGMLSSTRLAVVDYTTNTVLICGGQELDGSQAALLNVSASDHAAIVIWWDPAELRDCRADSNAQCDTGPSSVELFVNNTSGPPSNFDPGSATTISSLPFNTTADGTMTPITNDDPIGFGNCPEPPVAPDDMGRLFWTVTASATGDLPISVDSAPFIPSVDVADLTSSTDVSGVNNDCGNGRVFPVTSGHTYLIEVSHLEDSFFNLTPVAGGPVTLHVGQIGTLGGPALSATDNGSLGVVLNWTAADKSSGTAAPVAYQVTRDGTDSLNNGPTTAIVIAPTTTYTFSNLQPGHTYHFTVTAMNPVAGVPSVAAVKVGRASAPINDHVSINSAAHSATLSWNPPTSTSGQSITGYLVARTGNDGANTGPFSTQLGPGASSETFTNLLPGSSYFLSVRAITSAGPGSAAVDNARIPGPPDEPSDVSGSSDGGAKTGTINWNPPLNNGGSAVTGYRVSRDGTDATGLGDFSDTVGPSATSYTFNNLNGWFTYTLTVQAINALGTGLGNPVTVEFDANTPSQPTGVSAARGNHTATVVWSTPVHQGTSAITGYRIRRFSGSSTTVIYTANVSASTHSFTATGLTNGNPSSFDITARNGSGLGANSTRSNVVTPATVPNAPTIGTAVAGTPGGAITATAHWTAPSNNGGSAITGYRVTALRMSASNTVLGTTVSGVLSPSLNSFQMTLPVAGNYRFTVQAINAVGGSVQSARSNLVAGQ